jgi:hypothetical protein
MLESDVSYCCIDDKNEVITPNTHRVCFECGHVFELADDLVSAFFETYPERKQVVASEITFCPLCLHDWPM